MVWQDIVVALANVLFGYSLIWQVYLGFRDKKGALSIQTSLLTAIGLFALAISFFSLNLILSTIIAVFNGTMWLFLLVQRLIYKKA